MRESTYAIIRDLIVRYPALETCEKDISESVHSLIKCFTHGGKLLACGNGGSAADSEHIIGELMKGFRLPRKLDAGMQEKLLEQYPENAQYFVDTLQGALPAICLNSQTALMTAFGNDQASQMTFAQQVLGYGRSGDILLAISTSGNSTNILYAAQIAHVQGTKVIGLTGIGGGELKAHSDICIAVPSKETFKIQELHLPVYHCLCAAVENELFGEE